MGSTPNNAYKIQVDHISSSIKQIEAKLEELQHEKQTAEADLNSWSRSLGAFFGFNLPTKQAVDKDEVLLPKEQLEATVADLAEQIQINEDILQSLQLKLSDLARNERVRQHEAQEYSMVLSKQNFEKFFKEDPDKFYLDVLPKAPISELDTESIYASAEKIIAACGAFPSETNRYKLVEAWSVVQEARNRALQSYRTATKNISIDANEIRRLSNDNDKFYNGAQYVFNCLTDKGPSGLQGAKFLYAQRMFEEAEWYLNRAVIDQPLIEKLQNEVNNVCNKQATALLQSMGGFNALTLDVQQQLIQQQAFIIKYSFDLDAVPSLMRDYSYGKLQQYKDQLCDNIINIIANYSPELDINTTFLDIQKQITAESLSIQKYWFNQQFNKTLKVTIGSGLGIAWICGAGIPIGVAVSLALNAQDSSYDVLPDNLQVPSIESKAALPDMMAPQDYEFIQKTKEAWDNLTQSNNSANHSKHAGYFIFIKPLKNTLRAINNFFNTKSTHNNLLKLTDPTDQNATFAFADATLEELEKMSPHFGIELGKNLRAHFENRATKIRQMLTEVQTQPNSAFSAAEMGDINTKLSDLESDWEDIKLAAEDKNDFIDTVAEYLEKQFIIERNEYIAAANARNKLVQDIKQKQSTILSDNTNVNNLKISLDEVSENILQEQHALENLLYLKSNFERFKVG